MTPCSRGNHQRQAFSSCLASRVWHMHACAPGIIYICCDVSRLHQSPDTTHGTVVFGGLTSGLCAHQEQNVRRNIHSL